LTQYRWSLAIGVPQLAHAVLPTPETSTRVVASSSPGLIWIDTGAILVFDGREDVVKM
jgi:hypothetical protein